MTADTLAGLLAARADDDRPGLRFEERVWTWRAYVSACRSIASWLGTAGRHIGVICDNVPGIALLLGAAALSEHVLVALNPTRSPVELARDARATDVDVLVWDTPYVEAARHVADELRIPAFHVSAVETAEAEEGPAVPNDLVMLVFTSGTSSGRPRAVRVTQRKLAVPGNSLAAMLTQDDVVYCSMPLFHSGAVMAAYAPAVASGATLALRRKFSASGLLPDVRAYGATYLHYVGKALSYVLATDPLPDDAANPLKIAFGNEGSATATRRFGERFGCLVIDAFGSTETAISISPDPSGPPGSLGKLPDGIEIRDPATGAACPPEIVGELVNVRGLGLFDGYYNDPDADAERVRQGAFWSGDLAYADADGYVFFAGRGTERLRGDGENLAVAPGEEVLRQYPGVIEAAVYPVPDAAAGDQVMAALITDGPFDPAAFAAFLETRRDLGAKAVPRYVRLCAEFPLTPSHKVIKRILAAEGWRTTDPVWWRPGAGGFTLMGEEDVRAVEAEFVKYGRHDLMES
ncbi:MAG: AMP-binding protein [Nonomuraea sp.]|nr:AMP-binding protein [Nonomuraea sp.]